MYKNILIIFLITFKTLSAYCLKERFQEANSGAYVVTEQNFNEFITKYKKEHGDEWVFYAISVRGYEAMALNMADIKRYLEQNQKLIIYYEKAIQPNLEEGKEEDGKEE